MQYQFEVLYFYGPAYLVLEERLIQPCSHTGDMRYSTHMQRLFLANFNSERHL